MVRDESNDIHPTGQEPPIPWLTALRVLGLAHPYFHEKRGWGLGHLILKYQSGECKITRLDDHTYRVQLMGTGTTVKDRNGDRI